MDPVVADTPDSATTADNILQVTELDPAVETQKTVAPVWRRAVHWFCGFQDVSEETLQLNEQRLHQQHIRSLHQDPKARLFLNANLLILLTAGVFLYIFFTVPHGY